MADIRNSALPVKTPIDPSWYLVTFSPGQSTDYRVLVSEVLQTLSYDAGTGVLSISGPSGAYSTVNLSNITIPDYSVFGGEIAVASLTTFTIQPFATLDDTGAVLISLSSVYTKTGGSWAVGSGSVGALDTGVSVASNKQYYIWAIYRDDTGVSDILLSLSNSGPTLPANYTHKKLIGSLKTFFASTNFDSLSALSNPEYLQYGGNGKPYAHNFINPFRLKMDGTDIVVEHKYIENLAGNIECRDNLDDVNIQLRDEIIKTTGTFSAGSGNGAFEAALAIDTDYYVYAISEDGGLNPDIFISASSPGSVTLPGSFTKKQLIYRGTTNGAAIFTPVPLDDLDGYIDYEDTGTAQPYTSPGTLQLTNDGAGVNSQSKYRPIDVNQLWNTSTDEFDFSQLNVGDEVQIRLDMELTTTAANQAYDLDLRLDIGGTPFDIHFASGIVKSVGTVKVNRWNGIYIGSAGVQANPARMNFSSDANASIVMKGFYISVKRRKK